MRALSRIGTVSCAMVFTCLWLSLSVGGGGPERALLIHNPATGLRVVLPLKGVKRLTMRFFHSYDRQWVEESFRIDKGRFVPVEVSYRDDSYDYRHERYTGIHVLEPGRMRLYAIRALPSDILSRIATRVAHLRSQQLILERAGENRTHAYTDWGLPGERLVFSIK